MDLSQPRRTDLGSAVGNKFLQLPVYAQPGLGWKKYSSFKFLLTCSEQLALRGHAERVPLGVREHHPAEVTEAVAGGFGGAQLDQSRDLPLDVIGGEVEVHLVLPRRRILHLLERQNGPSGRLTTTKKGGAMGLTWPSRARAHHAARPSGSVVSNVMFSVLSAMVRR